MRKILILLSLVLPAIGFAQKSAFSVLVNGIRTGAKFYYQMPGQEGSEDIPVINGATEFHGEIENPVIICLMISRESTTKATPVDAYYIYITGGKVQVSFKEKEMEVIGNEFAVAYNNELLKPVFAYQKQILDLRSIQIDKNDASIEKQIIEANKTCFNVPEIYIKKHPDSPLCIQALEMMGDGAATNPVQVPELESLFAALDPKIRNSENGKAYRLKLNQWKERDLKTKDK